MSTGDARSGVFLAHRTALIDYATPILGSREAAEDIVQDAFLRFVPSPARIGSPEQTLAYLYRIVRNLAFDVLKHRKVEKRECDGGVPFWGMSREEATPEQSLLLCDQIRIVSDEALAKWVHPETFADIDPQATLDEINQHFLKTPLKGPFWASLDPAADRPAGERR